MAADLIDVLAPTLPYVDYFMPGLEEARLISGLSDRREVIAFFLDRGVRHTVFKMGADGSSIAWRGENGEIEEIRVPAFASPVVDSTGCGDAYCAGFIVGLLRGWDLVQRGDPRGLGGRREVRRLARALLLRTLGDGCGTGPGR